MINQQDLLAKALSAEKRGMPWLSRPMHVHLLPPVGWMNDPNGLCQWKGEVHLFFQYNPLDTAPGATNYWGHYTTRDYIHYDYHIPALCGDTPWDQNGVYSGSAWADGDRMTLYYTGNVKAAGDHDYIHTGREHNTLMAQSADGIHFSNKRLLLSNADYPKDLTLHVRDPKVVASDGKRQMLLGARSNRDVGEVLVYEEDGPEKWRLTNRLSTATPLGYMWECPDYFELGGKGFLSISPQGVPARGDCCQNIYQSGVLEMAGTLAEGQPIDDFVEYDRGFDFYAPQTFADEKGRRILVAWMGLPDAPYTTPTVSEGWIHALTLPRELSVQDGRLCQRPLPELKALRQGHCEVGVIREGVTLPLPRCFEAIFHNDDPAAPFRLTLFDGCALTYEGGMLSLSFEPKCGQGRTLRRVRLDQVRRLHFFVDETALEIFVDGGHTVFTSRFFPEAGADTLKIYSGAARFEYWPLSSFQYEDCSGKEFEHV